MPFTHGEWMEITRRGTSGDQVHDILADWARDAKKRLTNEEVLLDEISNLNERVGKYQQAIDEILAIPFHSYNEASCRMADIAAQVRAK